MRRSASFAALALAATSPFAVALDSGGAPPVPAGAYTLDKSHTSLIFRVSHMGFSTYTGRFTNVDAKLDFEPTRLANSRVNVTIDPRSIERRQRAVGISRNAERQGLAGRREISRDGVSLEDGRGHGR